MSRFEKEEVVTFRDGNLSERRKIFQREFLVGELYSNSQMGFLSWRRVKEWEVKEGKLKEKDGGWSVLESRTNGLYGKGRSPGWKSMLRVNWLCLWHGWIKIQTLVQGVSTTRENGEVLLLGAFEEEEGVCKEDTCRTWGSVRNVEG